MCGRYTLTSPIESLSETFGVETHAAIPPRFNIAPQQPVLIVRAGEGGVREMAAVEWGLVPEWKKERKSERPLINARVETVTEKASFRAPIKRTRCLVPFNGWYEWKSERGLKQPYYVTPNDEGLHAFAAIWTVWHGVSGDNWLETMAILTGPTLGSLRPLHHRQPLVVNPSHYDRWLKPEDPLPRNFIENTHFLPENSYHVCRVSSKVSNPRYDQQDCIEASGADQQISLL